jgi:hypothetical protein
MGGGIEGQQLSPECALIHLDVWNNAHLFWHPLCRFDQNWLNTNLLLSEATQNKHSSAKYLSDTQPNNSLQDYLFSSLRRSLVSDMGLNFLNIFHGANATKHTYSSNSHLQRSVFINILLDKIVTNSFSVNDQAILNKLIFLFSGQKLTGKFITPCINPPIEQYPEYNRRIEILKFKIALASKLSNNK